MIEYELAHPGLAAVPLPAPAYSLASPELAHAGSLCGHRGLVMQSPYQYPILPKLTKIDPD